MGFSWRKRRCRRNAPREVDPAECESVFAVVPHVVAGVMGKMDSQGCLQLKFEPPPRGRVEALFARRLGFRRSARVNLDARGTFIWGLIDGRRTLSKIEEAARKEWNIGEKESKRAVVLFIKMLMTRHLVELERNPDTVEARE
ncbi:PqqD family protein [Candidatus Bipolaricaulota bacterium]|nr:PqqD family protein [Candidatus Bipolaricaulota bacterium]